MKRTIRFGLYLAFLLGAVGVAGFVHAADAAKKTVDRMYVLECGELKIKDISANWSPGVNVGKPMDFSDTCYLIRHGDRLMLWDSGISDSVADKPEGVSGAGGLLTQFMPRTLASQLQVLNIAPTEVTDIAFSHFHSDHVGNANLFTAAKLYIQQPEYDAAFGPDAAKSGFAPAFYEKLRANPTVKLTGDYDVFGDGSVIIISTPGHTPGHQSLLVRLPKRGPVILSGDLAHFQDNWTNRRVPLRNFNKEQSAQSMEHVAKLLETEHGELWINHDQKQSARITKAPAAIE